MSGKVSFNCFHLCFVFTVDTCRYIERKILTVAWEIYLDTTGCHSYAQFRNVAHTERQYSLFISLIIDPCVHFVNAACDTYK